jgi:outer membrane protein insertion porin family
MPVTVAQAPAQPPTGGLPAPYTPQPYNLPPPTETQPLIVPDPQGTVVQPYTQPYIDIDPTMSTPVDVYVEETQTGRFMFGAGINSDAGVTGQIVVDERNFDITRFPTSFRDFVDGTAFRGGGQGFRLEAMPGTHVQRYLVSFTEPYFLNTPVSLNLSGFLYDRRFYDWDEARLGGRMALGYRLTPDLSVSGALRAERVEISDPRILIPDLAEVVGDNNLYSGRLSLTHDTRDIPFSPTEGHLIELSFEQVFGDFDYSRGEIDFRKYFLIRERPDGSGRHTLGLMHRAGFTGSQTPIFERFYAGGFSTMRGFDFRGASPAVSGVRVGGDFMFLGSAEYLFPLTADDMFKGALFVDYGTIEEKIEIRGENFRVAPGFGFRINVPALGPAPLAFDFAFPIAKADTDETRVFTFFFGMGR